jgi:hypothetical protein
VAIDQTAVVATMTATTAKIMILRISCHPFQRGELMIALAHRPQLEGEGPHTGRFFAIARTYRARRRHWGRVCNALGSLATAVAACIARREEPTLAYIVEGVTE